MSTAPVCSLYALAVAIVIGCGSGAGPSTVESKPEYSPTESVSAIAPLPGFSWVVPGELAAMPLPGGQRALDDDIAFLESQDIRVLVSLTEEPPDAVALSVVGIDQSHIPVVDFTAPTIDQMSEFVLRIESSAAQDQAVGVHCTAGLGRSGTMVAAYLVSKGMTASEAIAEIRRLRPGSVETEAQEQAIHQFELSLRCPN